LRSRLRRGGLGVVAALVGAVASANPSGGPLPAFVFADAFECSDARTWSTATMPWLANDVCALAGVLAVDGPAVAATTVGRADDYTTASGCGVTPTAGRDTVHRVYVLAGQRVRITATPAPGVDLTLWITPLVGDCPWEGPQFCLAGANAGGPGVAEEVVYLDSAVDRDLLVMVDAGLPTACGGAFTVEVVSF
jgi:hypothetical protein